MSSSSSSSSSTEPAGPWSEETAQHFEGKAYSKHFDPCQEAANKSIKCLHRNPTQKDLCNDYFQAYRDCKKLWIDKRAAEKRKQAGWW